MAISPMPLSSCETSDADRRPRSCASTESGTTRRRPRCIAEICGSIAPRIRQAESTSMYSRLLASVTIRSPRAPSSATWAAPTPLSGFPGQDRSSPASLWSSPTTSGSRSGAEEDEDEREGSSPGDAEAADGDSPAPPAAPSCCPSAGSSLPSSLLSGSVKLISKPSSSTGWARSHFTFVRKSSSSTSSSRAPAFSSASTSKPKSSAQTCGCSGRSSVQLCQSARPRSRPSAS
mmetsp:Transcript_67248/g.197405  ORF Transcript_67248/g.197405 Transcript_67248/m.197405 type:complete len:233 (-) Transcript_67248:461-1159(-)